MDNAFSKVEDEAYAKIIWGDSPQEVTNWLIYEKGLTELPGERTGEKSMERAVC